MGERDLNSMLVDVSKLLNEQDLSTMKFLCKDIVKKRDMEKVKVVLDLFTELQTREKITPTDLSFLKQLLNKCEKPAAIRVVQQYECGPPIQNGEVPMDTTSIHPTQPFQPTCIQAGYQMATSVSRGEDPVVSNQLFVLRGEINFLVKNLSREWRFYLRALGVSDTEVDGVETDYPRSLKDQIYQSLVLWVRENREKATKAELIKALRDSTVERFDLASKLEKGSF